MVEGVEISIDDRCFDVPTGIARPDVAAAFGDARLGRAGWSFECELDADAAFVVVSARAVGGERALVYAGSVRGA